MHRIVSFLFIKLEENRIGYKIVSKRKNQGYFYLITKDVIESN